MLTPALLSLLITSFADTSAAVNLVATHSSQCLDVVNSSKQVAAAIVQNKCAPATAPQPSQQWQFKPAGGNRFHIININSNMCLDVSGASQKDGTIIQQAPCNPQLQSNQLWTIRFLDNGNYAFAAVNSGKCLDVFMASREPGAQVIQWACENAPNQQWTVNIPKLDDAPPWGKVGGVLSIETEFTTPPYTAQGTVNSRIDVMSGNELTPVVHFNGATYFVWVDTHRRPQVTKIKNGEAKTVPLDPQSDYKQMCNGHGRFSMGIDPDGYLHITGDMHNYTDESTGGDLGTYPVRYQKQTILYWRSKKPESVADGFAFAGGKGAPTAIPGTGWTYGRFFTDNNGELYHSCRVKAIRGNHLPGEIGLGVYRYDTTTRAWSALGATPPNIRAGTYYKVVLWEQSGFGSMTPNWFQGIMPTLKFDSQNRLHVASSINSDSRLANNDRVIYAAARDTESTSWRRANGSAIEGSLIRAVSGLGASGDVVMENRSNPNYGLFTSVVVDRSGVPGVMQDRVWRFWNGSKWVVDSNIPQASSGLNASNQTMLMIDESYATIYATPGFSKPVVTYRVVPKFQRLYAVDEYALRREGVIYAIGIDANATTQSVVKISIK